MEKSEPTVHELAVEYAATLISKSLTRTADVLPEWDLQSAYKAGFEYRNEEVKNLSSYIDILRDILLKVLSRDQIAELASTYRHEQAFNKELSKIDKALAPLLQRKNSLTSKVSRVVKQRNEMTEFHKARIAHKLKSDSQP